MEPRLTTSRKWTPLPQELITQIGTVFKQNFSAQIGKGTIKADGKIFPGEILIGVSLKQPGTLKQSGFIISIAYKQNKDNVLKILHLAIDALAALFDQFFAAENDHDFPRVWEELDFEGRQIYIQYSTVNDELEAEADRLLGDKKSEGLIGGDWDEDDDIDAEQIKAKLGVDDEDGDSGGHKH